MSATNLDIVRALLIKAEASYNAGGSLAAATDGLLVVDEIQPVLDYLHDGARRMPPGIAGNMRRVAPHGKTLSFAFGHEAKGAAAAYSASVFPSIHRALLAAGFDGAVTTTGGSEKWDYTPTPATGIPTSLVGELYAREEKYPVQGMYFALDRVGSEQGEIPLWQFQARGILGTIAQGAIPAVTYPTLTTEPPKATNIAFTLGNFAANAVVRSWFLAMNRNIAPRGNQNAASGHSGFSPGRRSPILEVLLEASDLVGTPFHSTTGIDPYQLFDTATELSAQLSIGATQYNRWQVIPGKVQIAAPPVLERDDGAALWRLQLQCNPTTVNANDDVMFRYN